MVMKIKLEDKPNLFLELVAWRRLGFNAFKIPPRLQCIGYTGTSSNKHTLAPNVGAEGFASKDDSNGLYRDERTSCQSCGLAAEAGTIARVAFLEGQTIRLLLQGFLY